MIELSKEEYEMLCDRCDHTFRVSLSKDEVDEYRSYRWSIACPRCGKTNNVGFSDRHTFDPHGNPYGLKEQ